MAQIVKIRQKSPEFPKKKRFEELPKKELPVRPLKISKANEEEQNNKRGRAGNVWPFSPTQKAKVIENGKRI